MSSRDILSQEEVDALLRIQDDNDEIDSGYELTALDKDVIGEIGNISMGTAATALFTILNRKVDITTPTVSLTTFSKIVGEYDRPCVLVEVEYIEGVEGRNILIVKQQDAAIIADLMMGGDGLTPPEEMDMMHMSAVGEAMNQMMGSASTSLSNIINRTVNISPPITELLTLSSNVLKSRNFDMDEPLAKISFRMKIEGLVDSHIMQLAPIPFVKELVETLTGGAMAEAAPTLALKEKAPAPAAPAPAPTQEPAAMPQQYQPQIPDTVQQQSYPAGYPQQPYPGYPQQPYPQQPYPMYPPQYAPQPQPQQPHYLPNPVNVEKAAFPDFGHEQMGIGMQNNIQLIEDVPLQVAVQLGKTQMPIKDILELGSGSIIELDKLAGEPVDLLVNGKLVAKGEVVVIDENFGFRVKDIVSPIERLKNI